MDIGNCYLIFMRSMVGVVNIHSVLWSKGDAFENDHNRYFSDVQINVNGVDVGGYNHFELRNHKRAYELKDKNENIGFLKGSKNPAMEEVENWVRSLPE